MSNDNDVLEPNSQEEYGSVDIVDLLEIANSKVFDDEEGLPIKHRHTQVAFGAGSGSKISKQYQVRADIRLMARNDENEDDFAFQFSINRFFD